MPRSLKKGPFIDAKLEKKVNEMSKATKKKVIKTWSRRSTISPLFVAVWIEQNEGLLNQG